MPVRIAVVGDYQPDHETHPATTAAVSHAGEHLGLVTETRWIATPDVDSGAALRTVDGVWIAPGSPYKSLEGALTAICTARENGIPLLGTCAGFQHMVIEFARRVVGDAGAQHAEYDPEAGSLFITPLACSLAGQTFEVTLEAGSRAQAAYGTSTVAERYYCNFGLDRTKEPALVAAGLGITGRDESGEARIIELADHPFFVGTLFVPQVASSREVPHRLVTAFVRAASVQRRRRTGATSAGQPAVPERWVTDDDLAAARRRFADRIPGFEAPVAYGVARLDDGVLTFGHVNDPSSEHRLPAIVLASHCGYVNQTGTFVMRADEFASAVADLAPAEAATHWQHPNLWSWRRLLEDAGPRSTFVAVCVADLADPVVDEHDAAFRSLLVPDSDPHGAIRSAEWGRR